MKEARPSLFLMVEESKGSASLSFIDTGFKRKILLRQRISEFTGQFYASRQRFTA
jgi:hypothetical protein